MRVAVIGGGPAGLYFAILLKRDRPEAHITVVERNRPDDTFGFGVVFSDQTLDAFAAADPPSYRAIVENFAYWDDIEIHVRGTVHRIGGNGFCGCSRRSLLMLLHDRARALGVELLFNREATPEDFPDADLIVAADGINSAVRTPVRSAFPAAYRPAAQPLRLDGQHASVRRLHLLLQGAARGHLHRPLLPVRTRRQHLGAGNGARDLRSHRPGARRPRRSPRASWRTSSPRNSPATG